MGQFHHLTIEHHPSEQVIDLLDENIIGTPGKSMLYKHKDVRSKVGSVTDPYFANLSIRNKLYGSICLSKRDVSSYGKSHHAFYLRYFTFRESLRSKHPRIINRKSQSTIREDVSKLMNGEGLDYQGDLVLYAYVDADNLRSKRLIDEFGFVKAGEFNVIPFSRFYPKKNVRIKELELSQQKNMKSILREHYSKEKLVSLDNVFSRGTYFVIYDKHGDINCGIQAIKDGWKIEEMPGISGKIMMNVVPNLPILRRLFNPDYNFVFLENLYCKPGHEKELGILLESVLAYSGLYSGILCIDPKSQTYRQIQDVKLGISHAIMRENNIEIVVKTENEGLIKDEAPFFVSGIDVL